MQEILSNAAIIRFLKKKYKPTGFVDSLKIKYRSLICPFISLIQMVKPGEKAADVGGGSGQFLLLLSHFAEPSYLYGIEITQGLVDNANKIFSEMPEGSYGFETYNGIDFPEHLRDMDIVFLIDVLHHLPKKNQEPFIHNLSKMLKPGARLVLKDIDKSSPFVYCNKLHDIIFSGEIGNEISTKDAKEMLQQSSFEIIEQNKRLMYVYPHYTIVAKKQ